MSVQIKTVSDTVTAYLSGELDHHSAKEMREAVDNAVELNMPSKLVLDFKEISFMDSSGIGLVMGRCKIMKLIDGTVEIANASTAIKKVMRLSGLEMIVKI